MSILSTVVLSETRSGTTMQQDETLGSKILTTVDAFILNHFMLFLGIVCIIVFFAEIYYHYFRIVRSKDSLDIGNQYVKLEMKRRYRV